MRKLLFACLILLACNSQSQTGEPGISATKYNFAPYAGKTIKSMRYCDGCSFSGDLLIIEFADGTKINVYAYKYNMKIK